MSIRFNLDSDGINTCISDKYLFTHILKLQSNVSPTIISKDLINDISERQSHLYIAKYLSPMHEWDRNYSTSDCINLLIQDLPLNKEIIISYIKSMPYEKFIITPYWKAISEQVKVDANCICSICGDSNNLQVHHKTYKHHGEELKYMKTDLICVCEACHRKLHHINN